MLLIYIRANAQHYVNIDYEKLFFENHKVLFWSGCDQIYGLRALLDLVTP